jgi:SAM-dependent methyltransferase
MRTLTGRDYWDSVHEAEGVALRASAAPAHAAGHDRGRRSLARRLLGERLRAWAGAYDEHLLWNVIYPRHLPAAGASVVEIGSAPGAHLVELHRRFGLSPYGIEYSPSGAALNRQLFAQAGLEGERVIEADFFSPELLARRREAFDMVLSRGFVEHFDDVAPVVERHLELLRPGGLLVVIVPNLRGANRLLCALFHREVLALHNLEIMALRRFASLFDAARVEPRLCAYHGTFSFHLFNARQGSPMRRALAACQRVQPALNLAFRLCLGDRGAESRWLSPSLVYVGRKRS